MPRARGESLINYSEEHCEEAAILICGHCFPLKRCDFEDPQQLATGFKKLLEIRVKKYKDSSVIDGYLTYPLAILCRWYKLFYDGPINLVYNLNIDWSKLEFGSSNEKWYNFGETVLGPIFLESHCIAFPRWNSCSGNKRLCYSDCPPCSDNGGHNFAYPLFQLINLIYSPNNCYILSDDLIKVLQLINGATSYLCQTRDRKDLAKSLFDYWIAIMEKLEGENWLLENSYIDKFIQEKILVKFANEARINMHPIFTSMLNYLLKNILNKDLNIENINENITGGG